MSTALLLTISKNFSFEMFLSTKRINWMNLLLTKRDIGLVWSSHNEKLLLAI